MNRLHAPSLLVLSAFAALSCAPSAPKPPRGVLVVLIDCLRADHLGLQGSKLGATPALDALGPESVVFARAFAQASWTRPSVPSLLTGLYPSEHGLTDFVESGNRVQGAVLSPDATTLAEGMKAAGYRTALVGYQAQLSPRFGMDQGFDYFTNNSDGAPRIRKRFLDWLDEAPDAPFFGYLHFLDIHWPYCPPEATYGKFDSNPDAIRLCENWRKLREQIRSGEVVLGPAERKTIAARYGEELLALDGEIGQLFEGLKERGVWDQTLIVVTSDHGEELAERGGIEHGHTMHEELLHVPFLWKLPADWRRGRGRVDPTLVETRSLLPTLFDLVGQPVAPEVSAPSLLPAVAGRPLEAKPFEFVAAEANGIFSVRDERWKLIVTPATKQWQLYDLETDPRELTNLAEARPEQLREMQRLLRRWRTGLRPVRTGSTTLDDETTRELHALGYL